MKKKLLVILTAVIMVLTCAFAFVACGGDDEVEGTYYSYSNGEKVEGFSMKLEDGKAAVTSLGRNGPETANGTYEVDGKKVTVTITIDGKKVSQAFTIVSDECSNITTKRTTARKARPRPRVKKQKNKLHYNRPKRSA